MSVPLPHPAISVAPRRRLGGARVHARRSTISPRSTARSKFWGDDGRAAFRNWEEVADPRNQLGGRQGVDERIMLRELLRRRRHDGDPGKPARRAGAAAHAVAAGKIGGAHDPLGGPNNLRPESIVRPQCRLTEMLIPAGYVTTVYDPVFKLSADGTRYVSAAADDADHAARSRACRSRWCSAPSPAARTCCCRSPPPTKPPPSAASRRRPSARCHEVVIASRACGAEPRGAPDKCCANPFLSGSLS